MRHVILLAAMLSIVAGCGDDSGTGGGGGDAGTTSSRASSGSTAPGTTTTGAGGDPSGSSSASTGADVGGGGGDTGAGGAGDPVCIEGPELCSLTIDYPAKDCRESSAEPWSADQVAEARCVLQALRDRNPGKVVLSYDDHFGYCGGTEEITIGADVLYVRDNMFEDKGSGEDAHGYEFLDADVYQDCLDLPDEELPSCLGFRVPVYGNLVDECPAGCDCYEDQVDD